MQGKSTLCPLAGGSGSANMPPIPPPPSLRSGKVTGSGLHKPDEVETKSGPRLRGRDLGTAAEGLRAVPVRASCPAPALPATPQSAGRVRGRGKGIPALKGSQDLARKVWGTWRCSWLFQSGAVPFGIGGVGTHGRDRFAVPSAWGKRGSCPLPEVKPQGTGRED